MVVIKKPALVYFLLSEQRALKRLLLSEEFLYDLIIKTKQINRVDQMCLQTLIIVIIV